MFYLVKKKHEEEFNIGDHVMVLADFSGVPAGSKGRVVEVYNEGVTVEWDQSVSQGYRPLRDGFSRDELEYLALETINRPKNYE